MDLSLKRTATLTFKIMETVLMVMGEVDIGLISASFPPIVQVGLVDLWVYLFMGMREVDTGIISSTLIHINMVEYTLPT